MPLDLADVNGSIRKVELSYGDENYLIYEQHPAYEWLWHVSLSVAAMSSAISTVRATQVNDGDYIALTCIALDYTLRIPASQAVEIALQNSMPSHIPVTVHWGKRPRNQETWAEPLQKWLKNVIWPGFVDFVERHRGRLSHRGLCSVIDAVRNAYAHGGILKWSDQKPAANWHGICFDKRIHGKSIHDVVGYSDVLAMMLLIANDIRLGKTETQPNRT